MKRISIALVVLCACLGTVRAQDQGAPAIFPQLGHSLLVESVAFSPDGTVLASGSSNKTIKLRSERARDPHPQWAYEFCRAT